MAPKICPGSWTGQSCIYCRLLPWRKGSALTESCILLLFLQSYLFTSIPYQPVMWLVGTSVKAPGNSCLKCSVLLLRLGHPRPVLSLSAGGVGFQGVPCRRNYVPKSVFLALSYLSFFLFPLFNMNPSVKRLSAVISGKGSVLAWPALPTCPWRVN